MLCLSGFELYSRWVPLTVYHLQKVSRNPKCSWKYRIYSIKSPPQINATPNQKNAAFTRG